MRALGIDYGDARVGVAISDVNRVVASELTVIDGKLGRQKVVAEISSIVAEKEIGTVVIGYPLNMDGSKGVRTKITDKVISQLQEINPALEIVKWDERLTTVAANRALRDMGVKQSRKGISDKIAAIFILQAYLDSKRK